VHSVTLIERRPVEAGNSVNAEATGLAREYRCAGCGYGAVLRHPRPPCPMCGDRRWEVPGRGDGLRRLAG
jgi:rubrerythrin